MAARRYSYGIRIEGVGADSAKSEGLVFYTGNRLSAAQKAATDFEWVGGPGSAQGLVSLPDASDSRVSIFSSSLSTSAHHFSLHLDDVAAAALMSRQVTPSGTLSEVLDLTETSITLSSAFGAADAGTVVYIGDEAILLGTWTGLSFTASTRAYWGTRARPLPRYTRVYRSLPYRKGREVLLVRYDHATSTVEERWRGILDEAPATNDEHTALELSCSEILAIVADGAVNRGSPDLTQAPTGAGHPFVASTINGAGRLQGSVRPSPPRVHAKLSGENHWGAFQVGQGLVFGYLSDSRGIYAFGERYAQGRVSSVAGTTITLTHANLTPGDDADLFRVGDEVNVWDGATLRSGETSTIASVSTDTLVLSTAFVTTPVAGDTIRLSTAQKALNPDERGGLPLLHSDFDLDGDDPIEPVYEVLAVIRDLDVVDGVTRDASDMKSGTSSLSYPFHPLAIVMAMMTSSWRVSASGWDVLGPEWGLDCPSDWFDEAGITQLIADTSEVMIDQLVLGWDGEEVRPWDVAKQMCQTYGYFPAITAEGRITFRVAREAGPAEIWTSSEVSALPMTLQWMPSEGDGVDVISGRLGTLPWRQGRPYTAEMLDWSDADNPVPQHSRRSGILASRSEAKIDMPTRSEVSGAIGALDSLAASRHIAPPRIRITVDDVGFGLGTFVRLAALDTRDDVLRDADGALVAVDDSARWMGLVVGKRPRYETDTADIELLLTNYYSGDFPRFRAPAATIASGTTTLTLTESVFTDGDDGQEFTVGDVVELWSPTGSRRSSESRLIDSIGTHEIVLVSGFTITPVAGDILRLAHLDDVDGYPEDGNPAAYSGLAYAYGADADDTIAPTDIEGHIYGRGLI